MGTPGGPWLKWLMGGVAAGMVLLGVRNRMNTTDKRRFCASCPAHAELRDPKWVCTLALV